MLNKKPVKLFICYSHKDESLKNKLVTFLFPLKQIGFIELWEASQLLLGEEITEEILKQINQVDIFLFLVSPDSISSKYINKIELKMAFELKKAKKAIIVPVILRPCNWELLKINKLHVAPVGAKPVTLWENKDQAFHKITLQIEKLVNSIIEKRRELTKPEERQSSKSKKGKASTSHNSVFNGPIKAKYVFGDVKKLKINDFKKK